jgi:hypothetical protein
MHVPHIPPSIDDIMKKADIDRLLKANRMVGSGYVNGEYLHWDKIRHLQPPEDLTHEEWWFGIVMNRQAGRKDIPLLDRNGVRFHYSVPGLFLRDLHELDMLFGGAVEIPDEIVNREMKDRYFISSLMEEAITSSQLEGAATTRKAAREMLRAGRRP